MRKSPTEMKIVFLVIVTLLAGCSSSGRTTENRSTVVPTQGDGRVSGGRAAVRVPYEKQADDPRTTNDESNDQPRGHFGNITIRVKNLQSGNSYPVDADVENYEDEYYLRRIYFVKGGWVDFTRCGLDTDGMGSCTDENGKRWEIKGVIDN